MSAESKKIICDLALASVGNKVPLTSFEADTTTAGTICRLRYDITRRALLEAHTWNFAIRRAQLAQMTGAPLYEYAHQYQLPADCLKIVRTSWEARGTSSLNTYWVGPWDVSSIPYRIESHVDENGHRSRVLLTDEETVQIEYVSNVEDTALFSPTFTDCLAARMAAEIAPALTKDKRLAEQLISIADIKLREARFADAQQGSPREIVDTSAFLTARL